MFSYHTLILTPWMAPHRIVSWEDALKKLLKGTICVVHEYDDVLCRIREDRFQDFRTVVASYKRSPGDGLGDIIVRVPSVVSLNRLVVTHKRGVKFSRMNVYLRDGFRCQYCGRKRPMRELNYDHVIPKGAGGKRAWENIVTACAGPDGCNTKKANRTPEQAGMRLLRQPVRPKFLPLTIQEHSFVGVPDSWRYYFQPSDLDAIAVA